jgi:hypothetical protein
MNKLILRRKYFRGHKGRPGFEGGSVPRSAGKVIPDFKVTGRDENGMSAGDRHRFELTKYLRQVKKVGSRSSTESVVCDYGHFSFPKGELPAKYKLGKSKECFRNAMRLAEQHPELTYVEGFAFPDFMDIPIHHAWCVDKNNLVIDNTWPKIGTVYKGIRFDIDFIYKVQMETETYGVIDFSSKFFRDAYPPKV